MFQHIFRNHAVSLGIGSLHILLFVLAGAHYPGSLALYGLFSLLSWLMLWLSLHHRMGYGSVLLGIFLWLGLWLKLSLHLAFAYPYVEPTGGFEFSAAQYDETVWIASLAYLAVSSAWFIAGYWKRDGAPSIKFPESGPDHPGWAGSARRGTWVFVILAIAALNFVNSWFGIQNAGLTARAIFPWPINGVISWILVHGFPLLIAALLYRDFLQGKRLAYGLLVVILEALASGVTLLSRGIYLWHTLPAFWAVWVGRFELRRILPGGILLILSVAALAGFVSSVSLVNMLRDRLYVPAPQSTLAQQAATPQSTPPPAAPQAEVSVDRIQQLLGLATDRWLGVEGIMAAVGYPDKSIGLLTELLVEKPSIGRVTRYQYISNSHYQFVDAERFHFGTVPGVAGFLYLGGSFFLVWAGTFLLALFVVAGEHWVAVMTRNPFLCAVIGVWMANIVAQFGDTPRQLLTQLSMNLTAVILISLAQGYQFGTGWFADRGLARRQDT